MVRIFVVTLLIFATAMVTDSFPLENKHSAVVALVGVGFPTAFVPLWAQPGAAPRRSMVRSMLHFTLPATVTITLVSLFVYLFYMLGTILDLPPDFELASLDYTVPPQRPGHDFGAVRVNDDRFPEATHAVLGRRRASERRLALYDRGDRHAPALRHDRCRRALSSVFRAGAFGLGGLFVFGAGGGRMGRDRTFHVAHALFGSLFGHQLELMKTDTAAAKASFSPNASPWEFVAILTVGVLLVGAGCTALALKFRRNLFDPERAEAIARSIVDYKIPNGARGALGTNLGGAKIAVLTSIQEPPDVILAVGRIPASDRSQLSSLNDNLFATIDENFQIEDREIQYQEFCGSFVLLSVELGTLEAPEGEPPTRAVKYSTSTTFHNNEWVVVLMAYGEDARAKGLEIFRSLRCK